MEPGYRFRLYLLTALVLAGFGLLLSRLYDFQIEQRNKYLNLVPSNRTVTVREPGIRGEITDRNGVTLARNLRRYEISFNLEEIRAAWLARHKGKPPADAPDDIVHIVKDGPESTIERLRTLGLARNFKASEMRTHFRTHGGLIPYTYSTDLSYHDFARVAEHNLDLPGVYLSIRPQREYPYGALASHVLGYLKQWEKGDVPEGDTLRYTHYVGDDKGIAGIEASMDALLRAPEGRKTLVRDEKGRTIRMSDYTKPGTGAKVSLTIDARKQLLLESVLRRTGRAAGVVMDVNTGEVLAMASVPDFDPNAFIPSIREDRYNGYLASRQLAPLTNRAISPFAPGSTMKIATAVAGALQGMTGRSFSCDGYVSFGDYKLGCWIWNKSRGSHGTLTLPLAIQKSCNPYFNKLANAIGWRALVEGSQMVGLGKRTGIELPDEKAGILPGSPEWRAARPGAVMTPALTAQASIGQGQAMATPLQLCAMAACIANGGKYYKPRIIRAATAGDGRTLVADQPVLVTDLVKEGVKKTDLAMIRRGMWMAVNVKGGTGGKVKVPGIEAAAKTGTAQTTDAGKESHNSWVISFAPFEKPRYAVCVLVQNAGSGGAVCGPLVNQLYRGLFATEGSLPLHPQAEFAGNTDRIEELPVDETETDDATAATDASGTTHADAADAEADADPGETGDEAGRVETPAPPAASNPAPAPSLTPEADDEGTIIPRAIPVRE